MPIARRSLGFTLMELLITIVVIGILVGLLLPGLTLLRKNQRKHETRTLLNGLEYALSQYLDEYGVLGDNGSAADFTAKPWTYLGIRPQQAGREPYVFPGVQRLKSGTPPALTPASQATAQHICDAWGNALVWEIVNLQLGTRHYTSTIRISSTGGTPITKDDLVIRWSSDDTKWIRE